MSDVFISALDSLKKDNVMVNELKNLNEELFAMRLDLKNYMDSGISAADMIIARELSNAVEAAFETVALLS